MKSLSLSTKMFLLSGLVLILLCLASFGILYRAEMQLATREMDARLENEALGISALVSARTNDELEFEISRVFLRRYQQLKRNDFFRILRGSDQRTLRESLGAPAIGCTPGAAPASTDSSPVQQQVYRVRKVSFRPEIDQDVKGANFEPPLLCLVVGTDEAPYRALVLGTLFSTVPTLLAIVVLLIAVLLIIIRRISRDLSGLTVALTTADFSATHEFPTLPAAHTPEVKAVVEKLVALHVQAADVYREMWLFMGRAAHQLKTPVAAVQATLQVLLRRARTKDELLAGLADVEAGAEQLASLTRKLISSSRISYQDSLERELIDLRSFLSNQAKLFAAQASQHGVVLTIVGGEAISVIANASLLAELFGNLLENAILYSPRQQGARVTVQLHKVASSAAIAICDQGPGFSLSIREDLFQPFVRGDERSVLGSGLGLSIARKAARILGGDIALRATGPAGSEIVVTLPIVDPSKKVK